MPIPAQGRGDPSAQQRVTHRRSVPSRAGENAGCGVDLHGRQIAVAVEDTVLRGMCRNRVPE
jgi:hypothetical protein